MSFHNFKTIFLVIILNVVIKYVNSQTNIERSDLPSVLLNDKIFFAGGLNKDGLVTSDFFFLDLSVSFNTMSPNSIPFKEAQKTPFSHRDSALISSSNDTIYLFAGTKDGDNNLIYEYNQNSNEWSQTSQSLTPKSGFVFPKTFAKVQAITDGIQDTVYLYGEVTEFNMYIYNLITNSWNFTKKSPYELILSVAVMVNDEILYIGGVGQDMNKVTIMI